MYNKYGVWHVQFTQFSLIITMIDENMKKCTINGDTKCVLSQIYMQRMLQVKIKFRSKFNSFVS